MKGGIVGKTYLEKGKPAEEVLKNQRETDARIEYENKLHRESLKEARQKIFGSCALLARKDDKEK